MGRREREGFKLGPFSLSLSAHAHRAVRTIRCGRSGARPNDYCTKKKIFPPTRPICQFFQFAFLFLAVKS